MHSKHFYFMKGWAYARTNKIVAWGGCNSWQRKIFKKGYIASETYMLGDALREGFDNIDDYRNYMIKQTIVTK